MNGGGRWCGQVWNACIGGVCDLRLEQGGMRVAAVQRGGGPGACERDANTGVQRCGMSVSGGVRGAAVCRGVAPGAQEGLV